MASIQLDLYYTPTCPYCRFVLDFVKKHNINLALHNVATSTDERNYLLNNGGKSQVPCLFINGEPLYESRDIVAYLAKIFNISEAAQQISHSACDTGSGACSL